MPKPGKTVEQWQSELPENKRCVALKRHKKYTELHIQCLLHPDRLYWQRSSKARENEGCIGCSPHAQSRKKTVTEWQLELPTHKKCLEFKRVKGRTRLHIQCLKHKEQKYWQDTDGAKLRERCPECWKKTHTIDMWQKKIKLSNKKVIGVKREGPKTYLQMVCLDHSESSYWQGSNNAIEYDGCQKCSPLAGFTARTLDNWNQLIPENKKCLEVIRGRNTKLCIQCLAHPSEIYMQLSSDVKRKEGCEICRGGSYFGFDKSKPATFYKLGVKLKHHDGWYSVLKIGITNNTVRERYKQEKAFESGWSILSEKRFECGIDALEYEKQQKDKLSDSLLEKHIRNPERMFKHTKNSEVYLVEGFTDNDDVGVFRAAFK